jgi:hypothetical protein
MLETVAALVAFLATASGSLLLYKRLGILLFSTSALSSVAVLVSIHTTLASGSALLGAFIGLLAGSAIGLLHLPIIMFCGRQLALLVSVVLHALVAQFWVLFPGLTGGSGGLRLLHDDRPGQVMVLLAAAAILAADTWVTRKTGRLEFAYMRRHGPKADLFGCRFLPHLALYLFLWGMLTGAAGLLRTATLGFFSVSDLELSTPIAAMLLAFVAAQFERGRTIIVLGSILFIMLRLTGQRLSDESAIFASLFDVAFPGILFVGWLIYRTGNEIAR